MTNVDSSPYLFPTCWLCGDCYEQLCWYLEVHELECFTDSPLRGVDECFSCNSKDVQYHVCGGQEV